MGHKSWAILWQHFAAYLGKAAFWFAYANVQRKTSLLRIRQTSSWFPT